MGSKRYKTEVWRSLANFEEQSTLTDGLSVDRPYRANVVVENYVKGTAMTAQDLSATSDKLTIDVVKGLLMYVDNVDKIQNKWAAAEAWISEAMKRLRVMLDARFLYEVFNAADTIDDGDIGGTAGNPITLTKANAFSVLLAINQKADSNDLPMEGRKQVLSPQFKRLLVERLEGKESLLGDKTGENGNIGRYDGLEFYLSNNVATSARWTPANDPSDGDTITINGITFTAETSTLDAAGKFASGTNTATTLIALADFINGGGATLSGKGYALSTANQRTVQNWVAVLDNPTTPTYIEIRVMGSPTITVSGSDATDVWSLKTQHLLFTMDKAIDAVVQKEPSVEMASTVSAGKSGMNILPLTLAGFKTFYQGKNEIFDVQIDASNF
jgi:hypothetical protein